MRFSNATQKKVSINGEFSRDIIGGKIESGPPKNDPKTYWNQIKAHMFVLIGETESFEKKKLKKRDRGSTTYFGEIPYLVLLFIVLHEN